MKEIGNLSGVFNGIVPGVKESMPSSLDFSPSESGLPKISPMSRKLNMNLGGKNIVKDTVKKSTAGFTFPKMKTKLPTGFNFPSMKGNNVSKYLGKSSSSKNINVKKMLGGVSGSVNVKKMLGGVSGKGFEKMMKGLPSKGFVDEGSFKRMYLQRNLSLFGDKDKDGTLNIFDCQPRNPLKQATIHGAIRYGATPGEIAAYKAATKAPGGLNTATVPTLPVTLSSPTRYGATDAEIATFRTRGEATVRARPGWVGKLKECTGMNLGFDREPEALGQQERYEDVREQAKRDALSEVEKYRTKQAYENEIQRQLRAEGFRSGTLGSLGAGDEEVQRLKRLKRDRMVENLVGGWQGLSAALPGRSFEDNAAKIRSGFSVGGAGSVWNLSRAAALPQSDFYPKIMQSVGGQRNVNFPLKVLQTVGKKSDLEQAHALEAAERQVFAQPVPGFENLSQIAGVQAPPSSMPRVSQQPQAYGNVSPRGGKRDPSVPTKPMPAYPSPTGTWHWSIKSQKWVTYKRQPYGKSDQYQYQAPPQQYQQYPQAGYSPQMY